jgi:hypothetical protein
MSNVPNYRLPVKRDVQPPATVWRTAAPVVARGVALVAVGILGEWALRSAAKKAVSLPFRRSRAVAKKGAAAPLVTYTETVVVQRSVTHR